MSLIIKLYTAYYTSLKVNIGYILVDVGIYIIVYKNDFLSYSNCVFKLI